MNEENKTKIQQSAQTVRNTEGKVIYCQGFSEDITERKRAEEERNQYREHILNIVAGSAQVLLTCPDINEAVDRALAILGKGADVDRVYIFENHRDQNTGELLASQRFEWSKAGVASQKDNTMLINAPYRDFFPRWQTNLPLGLSIKGLIRDFPAEEQEFLERQGILSLLVVPVMIEECFWGFMGFDDCHKGKEWTESEESILVAAAGNIVNAIERKRIEEALRESENQYRTIFENTGNATVILEEDTTISLVNAEFEKMFHYARDEVEGKKSWRELVLEEDLERLLGYQRLRRIDPKAVPGKYELKVVDRNGFIHNVYMTVAMIPGTKKAVASHMDITPFKELENALAENESLYRNLFENAAIGMFQSTLEGRFMRINKAYATMLGYESPEEVITTITDTATQIHADPRNRAELLADLERHGWFYAEQPYLRKNGSIMIGKLAVRKVVKPNSSETYLEGIVEDITERKQAEKALIKSERELSNRAKNLEEVNTTMKVLLKTMEKDQEKLKESFLTNISERVMPYVEKLKKTPLNDAQKSFINIVETSLDEIASPFIQSLTSRYLNLTKKEIQIVVLIKEGKTSKEIAELLNLSKRDIDFHREKIREKLCIKNQKRNLQLVLRSFS